MIDLPQALAAGGTSPLVLIPAAVLLGALHGLEPGHSKTMMAAFIIAVKGTVRQAVLLGLAATASHTLVVWLVAMGGMWAAQAAHMGPFRAQDAEPWFQLASGVIIVGMAAWMLWRGWHDVRAAHHHHHHDHDHHHGHSHDHGHHHHHDEADEDALELATGGHVDAHEAAHAADIRRRFTGRSVTTGQIVLFGLTGGLIPCPGAITVLMLCLQLNRVALGATLVAGFSVGLALTMVTSGVIAALSLRHLQRRFSGFGEAVRLAPLVSGLVILALGGTLALDALRHLA